MLAQLQCLGLQAANVTTMRIDLYNQVGTLLIIIIIL